MRRADLAGAVDGDTVGAVWDAACAAPPWDRPAVWLHGDLHPANVLVAHGTLAAVIDLGDVCAGDPATDLASAWMLLPPPARPTFVAAYGADDPTWARAEGWAVSFALMLVAAGIDGRPTYEAAGRATLARVLRTGDGH